MSTANLDLRVNPKLTLLIDKGVAYNPVISGFDNIDTSYSAVIGGVEFNLANGKILIENNSLILNIGNNDFEVGTHLGHLVSQSKQAGVYFKLKIEIRCYDNC